VALALGPFKKESIMRQNPVFRSSLAAVVVSGLMVAGCGSSSSSSSTSTASAAPTLTKAQYLARGNAICTKGTAAQNAAESAYLKTHHIKQPSAAQIVALAKTVVIPNIQSQIDAVKALGAPSGDQQTVTKMISAAQADLEKVKANPEVLTGNTSFADSGKLLHAYGLKACAATG
jgi:outer membrane murein-binding lipoprotein Lpp